MKTKQFIFGAITTVICGVGCVKSYMYFSDNVAMSNQILLANIEAFSANPPEEVIKTGTAVPEGEVCHILEYNGLWRSGKRVVCHDVDEVNSTCVEGSCAYVKK